MNYGEKLKFLRERIGKSSVFIAKLLNISDSLYSRYEKEKQTIPLKHLITLCDFYEVSLDYIFAFTEEKNYPIYNKNYDLNIVGNRLKEFRKEFNLTQEKVAKFLKIDQPTWSIYEKGKSLIGTPFLYTICSKYNISADYLLGRTDNPKVFK